MNALAVVAVIVVLIVLCWWFCRKEHLTNAGRQVTYHYVDWCPACKSMFPIWYQVKQSLAGSNSVVLRELNEDIAKTDGIHDYPTIDMIDEFGTRRVYAGAADPMSLRSWIIAAQ